MNDEGTAGPTPQPPASRLDELERTCFVIMPFGEKAVGDRTVDFTAIFEEVFRPAIELATTPEGQPLIAARTDMDAFASSINQEMFEYIMYSRLAFADISGFNPNVFYEIGVRHSAQESGTVLFRQSGHPIPFDITTIKIFEYDDQPADVAKKSSQFITKVLSESLQRNRLDSPVRLALRAQWAGGSEPGSAAAATNPEPGTQHGRPQSSPAAHSADAWKRTEIEGLLRDAIEATRLGDMAMVERCYWAALRLDPVSIVTRMRLGLTLKRQGRHYEALEEFTTVTKLEPGYGEAWKEKGVVEGLIARLTPANKRPSWLPDGHSSLKRATMLVPEDFDAWSSLGGVLKNVRGDLAGAQSMYEHAAAISDGHPYPLLNALKLEAQATGTLELEKAAEQLTAAERLRRAQVETDPSTDTPWSYFDLAELRLYQRDEEEFIAFVQQGLDSCDADWQPQTFRNSLMILVDNNVDLPGLQRGIELVDRRIADWPEG